MSGPRKPPVMAYKDSSIDQFLWLNKRLLFVNGFWPTDPGASTVRQISVYLRITLSIIAVSSVLIPEILMIIVYWGDINVLTGVGCVATSVGQLFFKMLYILARRRSFTKAYFTARELWSIADNEEERQSVEKPAGQAKLFSIIFFVSGFSTCTSFTSAAVFVWIKYEAQANKSLQSRNLPFDVWYGFDLQRSPYFEISFGCQILATVYCCTGIIGLDITIMSLVMQVCGQFRLITTRFRAIGRKINKLKDDEIAQANCVADVRSDIGRCVEHHRRMIRMAKDIQKLLSPVIFVQLLTSGLEICLSGFALIACGNHGANLIKFACYLTTMFVQLIAWCWPGEVLLRESQAVGYAACYDVPWYRLPTGLQRDLAFIILRSQKECQITALGFQVMSLEKLTDVFNSAGSYFALLRTVYEKDAQ